MRVARRHSTVADLGYHYPNVSLLPHRSLLAQISAFAILNILI